MNNYVWWNLAIRTFGFHYPVISGICKSAEARGQSLAIAQKVGYITHPVGVFQSLEFVPKGGKVLLTQHDFGISALDERLQGIQEVLKCQGVAWKVICTTNEPKKAAELKANPDIHCVLGTGLTDTEAAAAVIERSFPKQDYKVAGFDLSPEILRLIKSGVIRFTIDQQPYSQGYYPVVQLALYCRYGIRPSDIDAGAGIVTASDAERIINLTREHYR